MARRRRPGLRGKLSRAIARIDALLTEQRQDRACINALRSAHASPSDEARALHDKVVWRTEERDSWREKADWWEEKAYAVLDEMTASRRTARIVAAVAAIVAVVMAGCVLHLRHAPTVQRSTTQGVPAQ